jgi:hypothetical protein
MERLESPPPTERKIGESFRDDESQVGNNMLDRLGPSMAVLRVRNTSSQLFVFMDWCSRYIRGPA